MGESEIRRATMMAPAPGFTARVMERIAERERAAARRRAVWMFAALFAAAVLAGAIAVVLLISAVLAVTANSDIFIVFVLAVIALVDIARGLLESGAVVAELFSPWQLLAYAAVVLAMTLLWVRVVVSLPQRHLLQTHWEA